MKSFDSFFTDLTSDQRHYELCQMHYRDETIKAAAWKIYALLLADETLQLRPMSQNRQHLYNLLCKNPPDKKKVDWTAKALEKLETEKKEEWVPLTGEARQAKLKEWMEAIEKVEMVSAVPKLTVKEIIEQGDWRAVTAIAPRSEVEKHIVVESHIEKVNNARRKMFLSAFPDASEEEIQAYIEKFKTL